MKWIFYPVLLAVWITGTGLVVLGEESSAPPVFKSSNTEAIAAKDGQKITVRGTVSTVRKSRGGTNFINFKDSEFYLVTFKSDLQAFEKGEPADLYRGKHLAVAGVVSIYKGKPQMKLTHPDMVKIADPDAPVPEPVKPKPSTANAGEEKGSTTRTAKKNTPTTKKKRPPVDPKKYFK